MAASGPLDMQQVRLFTDQIQALVGAEQRKVHAVSVTEDVIAGVPVRRIAPASGVVDRSKVLLNLHGGGFATDSGSLTENIPVAALSGLEVIAVLSASPPSIPFRPPSTTRSRSIGRCSPGMIRATSASTEPRPAR